MRAQRVLSLKKNSCINKSYLWKRWTIFSTKLYLSSLSWKSCSFNRYCRVLLFMSDHIQPWKWFAHIFHVPASQRILPDLLGEISKLTSHESRIAHVKDRQELTSVGTISKKKMVQLAFTGRSWEEEAFRLMPDSKYKVAFSFLPNDAHLDF